MGKESFYYSLYFELKQDYPDVPGVRLYVVKSGSPFPVRVLLPGNYLYALTEDWEFKFPQDSLEVLRKQGKDLHHPQIAKRKIVYGAGVFGWSSEGMTYLDNKSGCYCPDENSLSQVKEFLEKMKVPFAPNFKLVNFYHY